MQIPSKSWIYKWADSVSEVIDCLFAKLRKVKIKSQFAPWTVLLEMSILIPYHKLTKA